MFLLVKSEYNLMVCCSEKDNFVVCSSQALENLGYIYIYISLNIKYIYMYFKIYIIA